MDTHLKNSAFCRSIQLPPTLPPEPTTPRPDTAAPSGVPIQPPSHQSDEPTEAAAVPSPPPNLPFSREDWEKAYLHFTNNLLPAIVEAQSTVEKNQLLTTGLYNYFAEKYGTRKQPQVRNRDHHKQKRHDRALKKVTELKKKAKKEFRTAQREGFPQEQIQSLARNFFDLVRQSRLKRKSQQAGERTSARRPRQDCFRNFWKFASELLDDDQASRVPPQFSMTQAHEFFTNTYQSSSHTFQKPQWMPSPDTPLVSFNTEPISLLEVQSVIKGSKSSFHTIPI